MAIKSPNIIEARVAFGKKVGIFYSKHTEGEIIVPKGDIYDVLQNPCEKGDFSLGRRIKDAHTALIRRSMRKDISEENVPLLCKKIGIEPPLEKKDGFFHLPDFEIGVYLNLIDLKNPPGSDNFFNRYNAFNVKLGKFGLGGEFGIRYGLKPISLFGRDYPLKSQIL